jgi:hypothetical protein
MRRMVPRNERRTMRSRRQPETVKNEQKVFDSPWVRRLVASGIRRVRKEDDSVCYA